MQHKSKHERSTPMLRELQRVFFLHKTCLCFYFHYPTALFEYSFQIYLTVSLVVQEMFSPDDASMRVISTAGVSKMLTRAAALNQSLLNVHQGLLQSIKGFNLPFYQSCMKFSKADFYQINLMTSTIYINAIP